MRIEIETRACDGHKTAVIEVWQHCKDGKVIYGSQTVLTKNLDREIRLLLNDAAIKREMVA